MYTVNYKDKQGNLCSTSFPNRGAAEMYARNIRNAEIVLVPDPANLTPIRYVNAADPLYVQPRKATKVNRSLFPMRIDLDAE